MPRLNPNLYLQTTSTALPWKPNRPYPFSTVSFVLSVLAALPTHHTSLPDDAFAAKHMPDLGHDIEEFRVFHWKLQGWKKIEKKLTSPEFDCGGHKWYVLRARRRSRLRDLKTHSGGYFSSHSAILTLIQLIPSLCILITPTPRAQKRVGTLAPNLRWSFQTLTIIPPIPSAVRSSQPRTSLFDFNGLPLRCTSSVHRRRA